MTDRRVGIVALFVVSVLFIETFTFPSRPFVTLNTDFWPRVLLGLLGLVSIFLIVRGTLDGSRIDPLKGKAFAAGACCILYVLLLEAIGFLILTPIFIFLSSITLSNRRDLRRAGEAAVTAALGTATMYFIFQKGLLVQLPEGLMG